MYVTWFLLPSPIPAFAERDQEAERLTPIPTPVASRLLPVPWTRLRSPAARRPPPGLRRALLDGSIS
jgi:hypothetical protein